MMRPTTAGLEYGFSMINFVRLVDQWNFTAVERIMKIVGTQRLELVPSMLLGVDWDLQDFEDSQVFQEFARIYEVPSIQSLTFGLDLRLTDDFSACPAWQHRFRMLKRLGETLSCQLFILGSPGQKKLDPAVGDQRIHQQRFQDNCSRMAETLGPQGLLCLEHNTKEQGAEYCNNLASNLEIVTNLESMGCLNVGINLDTKCLLQEFSEAVQLHKLLSSPDLASRIKNIQVSLDFLSRSCSHAEEDIVYLLHLAQDNRIPISLEEFGLIPDQLDDFVSRWRSVSVSH
jgi:hypothetical protein